MACTSGRAATEHVPVATVARRWGLCTAHGLATVATDNLSTAARLIRRGLLLVSVFVACGSQLCASVVIEEPATDNRVYSVRCRLQVTGEIRTAVQEGRTIGLKLNVDGRMSFLERRLAATGRDSHALRSLRSYQLAEARIEAGERKTSSKLPDSRRLIVAEGRVDGIRHWSTLGSMTSESIDLLRTPGDSLALIALLPDSAVEAGSTWKPPHWVIQTLTGVEAVTKSELSCRIDRLDERYAIIVLDGQIEGAILGSLTTVTVKGQIAFDLQSGHIRQAQITQTEERAVGTVSPGMQVTATMYVDRQVSNSVGPLTDKLVDSIPIAPEDEQLAVGFVSPWRLYFTHSRDWHVFHQTDDVAVLRLIEDGSLVAQCNVSRIPSVAAGRHTPEEQFIGDIQTALGSQLREISDAKVISVNDDRWLYRVTARGMTRDVPMEWYYYLCAAPDGRQVAFVFSLESRLAESFSGRDLELVGSVRFLKPAEATAKKPVSDAR